MIIIPCYNEALRLPSKRILSFLMNNPNVTICFVDDGSTDSTGEVLEAMISACPAQIDSIRLSHNSGKAEAVRQGMLNSLSCTDVEWLGYWDADLATPLEEISHLLQYAAPSKKLLMCSRVKRLGATIDRHVWRHILGRVMATLISFVLKLPVYDTQCGAKLIRQEEISHLFSEMFLAKWLFDVEIIVRMQMKYPAEIVQQCLFEVPVYEWKDISGSKLKLKHMFLSLLEIFRICRKYPIRQSHVHGRV